MLRSRTNIKTPTVTSNVIGSNISHKMETKKLYHWNDIPEWQKDNHYIFSGYVKETLSYLECLRSLTYLHNESVNIYTHLLPGTVFFGGIFWFFEYYMEYFPSTTWQDQFAFSLFSFGAATALTLSSCFHCLKSHSECVATFGNKLDYLGIIILIITSMVSILYYSLIDLPGIRNFFWGLTMAFGAVCSVFSLNDRFRTNKWRPYRALMFVLFGLSGVFPIIAGWWILGGEEVFRRSDLWWVIAEGALYIFGAFLYAARVPERFAPGKFDIWGHSHQIFHVLVVIAACCHGRGLMGAYLYSHHYTIPSMLMA
ncbi:PAQR-type receptor [Saccharomycopsis crataegensis]|uniref:PAQR-type receptor n=1 Tax=Saccharomycopsis crataegensis TaxID=43959 RepID=A0AAV5QL76_9ASCO|nr:PAQR-type receptor [Saccharomycopsis crataegensis]